MNEAEAARGTWYRMHAVFNPAVSVDLSRENAFWIAAENSAGEIVATTCGRIFDWRGSSLADEVRLMYYGGHEVGQECIVTAALAKEISGCVYYGGGGWVSPDHRGSALASLMTHVARAYAGGRWPVDCAMSLIGTYNIEKMQPWKLGYSEYEYKIAFPGYPHGDVESVVCRLKPDEIYADFDRFAVDWREYLRVKKKAA